MTAKPCEGCDNWKQYSLHAPDVPLKKLLDFDANAEELEKDPPVMEMPVQSLITSHSAGDIIGAAGGLCKSVKVRGLAWGGGGNGVNGVHVSLDGGATFTRADLLDKPIEEHRKSQWSWMFFEKEISLPEHVLQRINRGESVDLELTSKAINSDLNIQPERACRNAHGVCVNHWYRIPVKMDPSRFSDEKAPDGDYGNKPSGGVFVRPFRNFKSSPD